MSVYTKSIQLLLCFVFLLWSIAGPFAQSPCFAVAADTLAPQSEFSVRADREKKRAAPEKLKQQLLPLPAPVLSPSAATAPAKYFPLTLEGRKISRALYRALREKRWTRAISRFSTYCAKNADMRKLIEQAGLETVLKTGTRQDKLSLIIACSVLCPFQQTLPTVYKNGEPLIIKLRDGTLLTGYFLRSIDRSRLLHPTVILLAPWSMNIRALRKHVEYFRNAGFNVVPVDHRHHGESQGAFFGLAQTGGADLNEIAHFLLDPGKRYGVDPQYLFAYGMSIGGAIALDAASRGDSPLKFIIAQGVPDITDEFLDRNFTRLFFKLPKNMYSAQTIRYIKILLRAGLLYFCHADVREEDVLPQVPKWIREIRIPLLYIREAGDALMSDAEYRDKIESIARGRDRVHVSRIRGEHARGHLEDEKTWEHVLDAFLIEQQVPFISWETSYKQLLLFESVPVVTPRPADTLEGSAFFEEAS